MTIIGFLTARLDDAEAHARKDIHALDAATAAGDWQVRYGRNLPASEVWAGGAQIGQLTATLGSLADGAEDLHARDGFLVARMVRTARRRAEQALRDVESKRRVLAAYVDDDRVRFGEFESCSDSCPTTVLDEVVKLLAQAYDQHPDYRSEWAP